MNRGSIGEIDILEKPSLNTHMNHALQWAPEEYVFYVDGRETRRTKACGVRPIAGKFVNQGVDFD